MLPFWLQPPFNPWAGGKNRRWLRCSLLAERVAMRVALALPAPVFPPRAPSPIFWTVSYFLLRWEPSIPPQKPASKSRSRIPHLTEK